MPTATSLNPLNNVGFRLEIKPSDGNGTLISHVGDTQKISLVNGEVVYAITTTTGAYSVTSAAVALDQWHTIAGRYQNGQLELSVDGVLSTATGGGDLAYASSTQSLTLGFNYQGQMNSFRWYDWNAPQLLQLPSGSDADTLALDTTGAGTVAVTSKGSLGTRQPGSTLKTLRVAVMVGDQRHYVSVMSQAAFKEIGIEYTDNYSSTAPPINLVGLRLNPYESYANRGLNPLDYLIKPAHAAWWDIDVWEAVKTTVSILIPYEDFAMLGKQLYYLANQDWQNFNAADLTFSALGVATVLPVLKPLKPLLGPVKTFIRRFGSKPIIKHLSGVLGKATEQAVKGNSEKLFKLLPYFLIVADIARADGGLAALETMVDSIDSPDDLWSWINYFSIPAGMWEGEQPDAAMYSNPQATMQATNNYIDWLIPAANAARVTRARVAGDIVAQMIVNTDNGVRPYI